MAAPVPGSEAGGIDPAVQTQVKDLETRKAAAIAEDDFDTATEVTAQINALKSGKARPKKASVRALHAFIWPVALIALVAKSTEQ